MKNYIFGEKNGPATMTIPADSEDEAKEHLRLITNFPTDWILLESPEDYEEVTLD